MATIRRLPSGNWNVQVRIRGLGAKSKSFPTKEQAESWATREESVHKLTKLTEDAQWPTVLELGMAYAEAKLKSCASYWKAQMMARQLGESFPLPINQLTAKMVNDFKFKRLTEVSGETCRGQLAFLSRFYRYARRELLLDIDNPVARIVMPPPSKPCDKVVSREELTLLLSKLKPTMALIVEIAYETAMRRSEIIKLTPSCLHLQERIADVIDGKTGTRNVPLTRRAVELLQIALERCPLADDTNARLFNLDPHSATNAVRRARQQLGLGSYVRIHQLRHTRITNVARKGLNNAQIMVVSGHRDPRSVTRYTHLQAKDVLHLID